jgi:cellulose synthase/poly-beta-1,6-N-acetylglucosamine synthase-like glycosyltransferase
VTWQDGLLIGVGTFGSLGLVALSLSAAWSLGVLPRLSDQIGGELDDKDWPIVSIIVPACNEEDTLEAAAQTLLAMDYPKLELILINDRSTDNTGRILDQLAQTDDRIVALHLKELPEGWLGKLNAMQVGTLRASGALFLFTDADVHFAPQALRRAVEWMERDQLGHLSLLPRMPGKKLPYNAALACFAAAFLGTLKAWKIGKPNSTAYGGVGAFSLVRRSDFDRTLGWEWLKMEVGDDVGLAMMMVRQSGAPSVFGTATNSLKLQWYPDLTAMVRGLRKNAFGVMCGYSGIRLLTVLVALTCLLIGPALALYSGNPWACGAAAIAGFSVLVFAAVARTLHQPFLASLLFPLGLPILMVAMVGSAWATLRQRGIYWRGHLYPLEALKKGRRVDL